MISAMASPPLHASTKLLDRILAMPSGLIALSGADGDACIAQFAAIARRSGQAVYCWQPEKGLGSLRDAYARVSDCEPLGRALRYVQQSMHFGVYLFRDVPLPLSASQETLLRQLALQPPGHPRKLVLVDAPERLVRQLAPEIVVIDALAVPAPVLRLRDGEWLA